MIAWPLGLRFRAAIPNLTASWRSGGAALSGVEQRVQTALGPWRVTIEGVYARGADQIRAAQAMLTRLKAGESIIAPVCERAPIAGATDPAVAAFLTAPVATAATSLTVLVSGGTIPVGALLGLPGSRIHRVVEVTSAPASPGLACQLAGSAPWADRLPWSDGPAPPPGNAYTVRILPATRAPYAAGAPVALRDLTLLMRLASADDGDMPSSEGRAASFDLPLIEAL